MLKKYAIINFKGGVGKTTITWLLGSYLHLYRNKKILLVDLDPQMSLTLGLTLNEKGFFHQTYREWLNLRIEKKETIFYLMEHYYKRLQIQKDIRDYIFEIQPNFYLLPSNEKLYFIELMNYERKRFKMFIQNIIEKLNQDFKFDVVLFDCPPNFTNLTYSVFEFIDEILIPCNPDIYAKIGVDLLIFTLKKLISKFDLTKKQYIFYLFLNKARLFLKEFTQETNYFYHQLKLLENNQSDFSIKVLNTYLPERVDIKRSLQNFQFPEEFKVYFDSLSKEINLEP